MRTAEFFRTILNELDAAADALNEKEAAELVEKIVASNKIFVAGAGRSGLMAKSFVMRMMHMGLDAYAVGETTTPQFEDNDLIIIASGSGETKSLVSMAEKARSIGGSIACVTISTDSTLGKMADLIVKMPGAPKDQFGDRKETIQPMGSLFEQTLLLFFDAVILKFMEKKGLDSKTMYGKHANLE
ncbi:6-phospho-3-hexuloisomerase [Metabacillus sp. KIGAM252]|uniref:6-phospho-3-hexuloisomerase n=1 Tax=Metabacillus flavus TaxID=2823519 RepID=A0ABS5LID2_9BACI|nr:6-phospho-3-hexuloisomerase [Metabacillus flavus]MBS2970511.1 6-phospho-3-hexuloisomerase [Metabacillus flavus]